jgi:hypothetical protein
VSCVSSGVRIATLCFALAALAAPAGSAGAEQIAEDDPDLAYLAVPTVAGGVGVFGHATYLGALPQVGYGPSLELALGSGRSQLFGEAALAYASQQSWTSNAYDANVVGWMARGGLGVRWLARQFQVDRSAGLELFLLGGAGIERYWWKSSGKLTRPDVDLGVAIQMRAWGFHQIGMRMEARVVFAPNDRTMAVATCRGSCAMISDAPNAGMLTAMVITW